MATCREIEGTERGGLPTVHSRAPVWLVRVDALGHCRSYRRSEGNLPSHITTTRGILSSEDWGRGTHRCRVVDQRLSDSPQRGRPGLADVCPRTGGPRPGRSVYAERARWPWVGVDGSMRSSARRSTLTTQPSRMPMTMGAGWKRRRPGSWWWRVRPIAADSSRADRPAGPVGRGPRRGTPTPRGPMATSPVASIGG
jgi:hypothetical protein